VLSEVVSRLSLLKCGETSKDGLSVILHSEHEDISQSCMDDVTSFSSSLGI
jgi:hypothetical protein